MSKLITDRFIGDHKTFRKLIKDLDDQVGRQPEERDQKRIVRLVELFKDHLILHAWGEETFYYPVIRNCMTPLVFPSEISDMNQLDREHQRIDELGTALERQVKEESSLFLWTQTYRQFVSDLTAHMEKEENILFPFSEGLLGKSALEKISDELERRRGEAPAIRRHASF